MARPKKKYQFWDAVYVALVLNKENKYLPEYIGYRYTDCYPCGKSGTDIKIYATDSSAGINFASVVAQHFHLKISFGNEKTKFGNLDYAVIEIPEKIAFSIYNDDYED